MADDFDRFKQAVRKNDYERHAFFAYAAMGGIPIAIVTENGVLGFGLTGACLVVSGVFALRGGKSGVAGLRGMTPGTREIENMSPAERVRHAQTAGRFLIAFGGLFLAFSVIIAIHWLGG